MASWDMTALLLRQIQLTLAGANWQRSGGKGQRPKPIPLPDGKGPDGKGRGDNVPRMRATAGDLAQRLRNLGMIPAGAGE